MTHFLQRIRRPTRFLVLSCFVCVSACDDDSHRDQPDGDPDAGGTGDLDTSPDGLATDAAGTDAGDQQQPPLMCSGTQLFGRPNATTGLSSEQCTPFCADCGVQGFEARSFSEAEVA
ncbi:MAG: hypothetical protein KGO50_13620, partial [Myxococcales bacterium]|nr:hypothetical protein [Myxococcales bacterium]